MASSLVSVSSTGLVVVANGASISSYKAKAVTRQPTLSLISGQHYCYYNNEQLAVGHVKGGGKYNHHHHHHHITRASKEAESTTTMTTAIEKAGVKIINNPPESKLTDLGVRSWPKWGCPPSKFPWTYSAKETCYLLKGKVKVYPDGSEEAVEIGAGDLVEFPKGMSCTWDVSEEVDKHYNFE